MSVKVEEEKEEEEAKAKAKADRLPKGNRSGRRKREHKKPNSASAELKERGERQKKNNRAKSSE